MTRRQRIIGWLSGGDAEEQRRWSAVLTYSLVSGGMLLLWQFSTSFVAPVGVERIASSAALLAIPFLYLSLRGRSWGPPLLGLAIVAGFVISVVFSWGATSGIFLLAPLYLLYAAELTGPVSALWLTAVLAAMALVESWAVANGYLIPREGIFHGPMFPTWLATCTLISGSLISLVAVVNDRFLLRLDTDRRDLADSVVRQESELERQRELSELCRGILRLESSGDLVDLVVGCVARGLAVDPEQVSVEEEPSVTEATANSGVPTSRSENGDPADRVAMPVRVGESVHATLTVRIPTRRGVREDEREFLTAVCGIASVAYDRRAATKRHYELLSVSAQQQHLGTLGGLVTGIAHDINNPTSVMLLNVQTVRRLLAEAWEFLDEHASAPEFGIAHAGLALSREQTSQTLDRIEQATRRIQGLTEELHRAARADVQTDAAFVEMGGVVKEAVQLLVYRRYAQDVTVEVGLPAPDEELMVAADADEIRLAVMHLLNNAYDAITDGGKLVSVRAEFADGGVVVTVEDDGSGIPVGTVDRIAEPFYTTRREEGRRGLGLFRVSRTADAYGGRFTVEVREQGGTRAILWLPAATEDE